MFTVSESADVRAPRISPKRPRIETAGLADVFPYYAGFSFEWAQSHLAERVNDSATRILDPWNGSGTTTLAAQSLGIPSIGIDLSPIANVVAKLRAQVVGTVSICDAPSRHSGKLASNTKDPLSAWLAPQTVRRVRDWTKSFSDLPGESSTLGRVALFRVIRRLTSTFEGSNPTWVRKAANPDQLVNITDSDLDELLLEEQNALLKRLESNLAPLAPVSLVTASSTRMPVADSSIDLILTSPPYLTRIDYAVAYSRELAVMGYDIATDRTLRSDLMGTTLIRKPRTDGRTVQYGQLGQELVRKISGHKSKASSGYYLKQARQYLDDLACSFDELSRVSKPDAVLIMVVQDSYYKEIPIRLAEICENEAKLRGWCRVSVEPFEVQRTLTSVNTAARSYSKGRVFENVLTLRKERS